MSSAAERKVDLAAARQGLAHLDEQARVVRVELSRLRDELATVQSEVGMMRAKQALEASEQMAAAALKADLISKAAIESLAALTSGAQPPLRGDGASRAAHSPAVAGSASAGHSPEAATHQDLLEANENLVLASLLAQQMETQAKELYSQQILFMAMVAHELRNPLHPIRAATALLERVHTDESLLTKLQGIIERQVVQMSRLIEDLLDGSSLSAGTLRLRRGPVAVVDTLRLAAEASRPAIDAKRQRLELALPATEIHIHGDPARLMQVFTNLLDNASKYTPEDGEIRVEMVQSGPDLVVSVTDDGIGISPEILPRVFDLYVQDPRARAHSRGGLGIGLAVVRDLVEAHGGTTVATSPGLGRGSRFIVTLPLEQPPDPAAGGT